MIGIMSSTPQQATSGQPNSLGEVDSSVRSPTSGALKMSMITSFFKPKTPKLSPQTPLSDCHQEDAGKKPPVIKKENSKSDLNPPEVDSFKARGQGRKSKAESASKLGEDFNNGVLVSEESETRSDGGSGVRLSKPEIHDGQHRKEAEEKSVANKKADTTSKKRKKASGLDSSSDDFEIDKRTKMPKKEVHKDPENDSLEASKSVISILDESQDDGSIQDIFDIGETSDNPKVISFMDFLNESMGENTADKCESQESDTTGTKQTEVTEIHDVEENRHISADLSQNSIKITTEESNQQKDTKSVKKASQKSRKRNTARLEKQIHSKKLSEDVPLEESSNQTNRIQEEQIPSSHVFDDTTGNDSVLTVSYSEFLEDKTCRDEQRPSPATDSAAPLQLTKPKKKLITIEAQVHIPPVASPGQVDCDRSSPVSTDPVTIDLCHSPEDQKMSPGQAKRTSNVVVNMSDLDLMIVSTEDASLATESKNSRTVYSIFQKRGTMEKPTESKKPKQTEVSQNEPEVFARKARHPKKQAKETVLSPERVQKNSPRKASRNLRTDKTKTQNPPRAKRTLKAAFSLKTEDADTEEEFEEEEVSDVTSKVSRGKGRSRRLPTSSSQETHKDVGGRLPGRSSKRAEAVVMTSTPKAKNNKNAKAQKLLRQAKSRQLNRSSPVPFQDKGSKRVAKGTGGQKLGDGKRAQSSPQRSKSELRNPTKNQRDLTNVLGKKATPSETSVDRKKKTTEGKGPRMGEKIEEVESKKPTKLAPMFTVEGRLALAKKQKPPERLTSDPCAVTVLSDDETSRDSVRSETGGDMGGTKLMGSLFAKFRGNEVELAFPPFPTVSHVLQMTPEMEGDADWWKLPSPFNFGKFCVRPRGPGSLPGKNFRMAVCLTRLGEFTLCSKEKAERVDAKMTRFTGYPELSHDTQRIILDRIKAANPRFPVNRVFKRYLAKRKGEPPIPRPSQVETAAEPKPKQKTDSNFTQLKEEKLSSAKRKSEVLEQHHGTKRRRVAQEGPAGTKEVKFTSKIRLRRKSSKWAIQDKGDGEGKESAELPKPRRSLRQSVQVAKKENDPKEAPEGRTLRTRKVKKASHEEPGKDGEKEGSERKADDDKAAKLAGLLWTDKYQPQASTEVIGNPQAMKRLAGWLTEWKKRTVRMKKMIKRQQGKQQSKTLTALPGEDSDSDFDMGSDSDSSDSDDDDDSLSNAMVIVGPTGCGKTSAVYACAKEFGFKIFEVNASSKRTGKQILSDLGEATQSHHLSAHHHGNNNNNGALKSFFTARSPTNSAFKPEAKKKATPVPKAFAAFYKAGADAAAKKDGKKVKAPPTKSPNKSQAKPAKQAAKAPSSAQPQQAPAAHCSSKDSGSAQRLSSSSLILFEDVDVVFEEDKGFLSAIATFLKTTKRPIILTTSDDRFLETFEERCETISLRKPSSLQLATHLQLLCLAENFYASHSDLQRVVSHLDRDVRCCLLATQFWVTSGAGQNARRTLDQRTNQLGICRDLKKSVMAQEAKLPVGRSEVLGGDDAVRDIGDDSERSDRGILSQERGCFESTLGLCNLSRGGHDISSLLNARGNDGFSIHNRSIMAEMFHKSDNASVYFRNIHSLLPRISSERSNPANRESSVDQSGKGFESTAANGRGSKLLNHRLMTSIAGFADDISSLDSHTYFSPRHDGKDLSNSGWWTAKLRAGLSLDSVRADNYNFGRHATSSSIRGFVEAASFDRCYRNCEKTVEQFKALHQSTEDNGCQGETDLTNQKADEVPMTMELTERDFLDFKQQEVCTKCPELYSTLVSKLPLLGHCNHAALATEYLPTLRCICRSEQIREEMKIKRRFLHYLDSISLNLKKTDQIALCSILEVRQDKESTR